MRVVLLRPGTTEVTLAERPDPVVRAPREILVQVLEVGICGTDREQAAGLLGRAPEGSDVLIPGHEMLGKVVQTGEGVRRVRPGDLVVLTVRRPCGACVACDGNRPDLCETGQYRDRGVIGMDGFQAEFVVDEESAAVLVPPRLRGVAVLCEPLSVVEKGLDTANRIQKARLPWLRGRSDWLEGRDCLVVGVGPVGLLAAMALRLRGARVTGLDLLDETHARPRWLREIGGTYLRGWESLKGEREAFDLIVEAAGATERFHSLIPLLRRNGVLVYIGNAAPARNVAGDVREMLRHAVVCNNIVVGIVNAGPDHYHMAIRDLQRAVRHWGSELPARLITHRVSPEETAELLKQRLPDEIKAVVQWAPI